ncbi:MAG: hypothetical protein H6617_00340 [Bdellovibrionaceae bacterium]|nr:hypothetical protein [Bdellovibrionales bacterium]MCB9253116.1 hypothetical protein [Pseudobdellovibrionaceae bacterium]
MKFRFVVLTIAVIFASCTKKESTDSAPVVVGGPPALLQGKITYSGKVADPKPIKMAADPVCNSQNKANPATTETLLVGEGNGLANVFVYVEGNFKPAEPTESVVFDQAGCRYIPHVVGIQAGQTLQIKNSDSTLHNVNAQAKTNSSFNVGMATRGQVVEKTFSRPEVIKFKCDVHGWMAGYVGVAAHSFFAVTDEEGSFTIPDVPSGEYTLVLWHEKLGERRAPVNVAANGPAFQFDYQP